MLADSARAAPPTSAAVRTARHQISTNACAALTVGARADRTARTAVVGIGGKIEACARAALRIGACTARTARAAIVGIGDEINATGRATLLASCTATTTLTSRDALVVALSLTGLTVRLQRWQRLWRLLLLLVSAFALR